VLSGAGCCLVLSVWCESGACAVVLPGAVRWVSGARLMPSGAAWCCVVLSGGLVRVWYCLVLSGACLVLPGAAWCCLVLSCAVWVFRPSPVQKKGRQPVEVDPRTSSKLGAGVPPCPSWQPGHCGRVLATAVQVVVVPGWGPAGPPRAEGRGVEGRRPREREAESRGPRVEGWRVCAEGEEPREVRGARGRGTAGPRGRGAK